MADLEKTVAVIFQGDDRITSTVRSINRSFGDFSNMAQTVATPLAAIAEGVIAADAAFAAMALGGMALAIRESGRFGDSFNEIATLINVPRDRLDDFRRDIIEYAKDSTASIDDINAAVYTAISAGTDYAHSLDVLSVSERLSVAGKADLEATTRLLASTLNAYGESVDQAGRYSDVFFQTVRLGQTTLPELADGLSQVTGLAANAGVPIETLMAALAALTATGAPTSQAITQVRAAIQAMIDPSQEARELAAQLGIQFNASGLQALGFEGVLRQVYDATGGNVEQMSTLFGRVEGLNAALVLGADTSGKFAAALLDMRNATGATEEAFARMAENLTLINQTLANDVRAILIALGDDMIGGYSDVARGLQAVLQTLETEINAGTFDPIFDAFDNFAAQLAVFLGEVATALPEALSGLDYSGFVGSLEDLGRAIGRLFGDVDLTTAEGLESVLQEIIDTGEALIRVTIGMAEAFRPYLDVLRLSVQEVNDWDAETQASFGKVLLAAEGVVRAGTMIGLAMAAISQSGSDVSNVFNVVVGSIQTAWNALQVAFDTVASIVVNSVIDIIDFMEPLTRLPGLEDFNASLRGVREELGYLSEAIRIDSFHQMEDLVDGATRVMDGFAGRAHDAADATGDLADAVDAIPDNKAIDVAVNDAVAVAAMNEIQDHLNDLALENPEIEILPILAPDSTALDEINRIMDQAQGIADDNPPQITPEVDTEAAERELERLKIGADLIRDAMKYEAEVDIAMAQEATRRLEAAFSSVNVSIQSTGETLVGLFGQLGNIEGISNQWRIEEAIDQEIRLRQQAFELQQRLVNSTIELNRAQAERLESGDAFFTISAEGLTPALEMVLMEIVQRIQMQVIANGDQALIDLGSFTGI